MGDINFNDQPVDFNPVRLSDGTTFVDLEVDGGSNGLKVHVVGGTAADGKLIGADGTTEATVAANAGNAAIHELATHDTDLHADMGAELTGNTYPAGASGVRGGLSAIYQRVIDLVGDAIASPAANTIGDRLKALYTRLGDGSARAMVGQVHTTTPAAPADLDIHYVALDDHLNMQVVPDMAPDLMTWQVRVARIGSLSTASTTAVNITDGTAVPTNCPAQNSQYTVPAGKKFKITAIRLTHVNGDTNAIIGVVKVNGSVRFTLSANRGSDNFIFTIPPVLVAGDVVTLAIAAMTGTQAGVLTYVGVEEPA